MKSHRLPILLLAAAAASASGAAGAASLSYNNGVLTFSDPACTGSFTMDTSGNITCSTAPPPSASAPVCTLTATPSAITAGASVNLSASCNPVASSYNWSSNTGLGTNTTTSSGSVAPTVTTIYSVAGTSGGLTGATATATVTVNSTTTPPSTGDDTLCTQANLENTVMPLDWGMGNRKDISIGLNQSVSFPLMISTASVGGSIGMVYTSGGAKVITISQNKCDFSLNVCLAGGSAPTLPFKKYPYKYPVCQLTPGVQYYVNVRNAVMDASGYIPKYPIVDSCPGGSCVGTMSYSY